MIWRRLKIPVAPAFGLVLLIGAVVSAVASDWIAPMNPNAQQLRLARRPPAVQPYDGRRHVFGTDHLGRDVFSRVLHGARISLAVALQAVALALGLGVALGLLAGGLHSRAADLPMRLVDVQMAIPTIALATALIGVLGPTVRNVVIVFALTGYPTFARISRAETLQLREREFAMAARALGASDGRIVLRHFLPNIAGPVLAAATLETGAVILYESGLGFLGLSVPPRVPSWGGMLADGRQYLSSAWWIAVFPGAAILSTVLGLNLVGDWLHGRLAPETRR